MVNSINLCGLRDASASKNGDDQAHPLVSSAPPRGSPQPPPLGKAASGLLVGLPSLISINMMMIKDDDDG